VKRLLAVLLAALNVNATEYYLSPTGTGNGLTPATPAGFDQWLAGASAGDVFWVRGGNYVAPSTGFIHWASSSGTSGNPIIVRAFPGEQPALEGQSRHSGSPLLGMAGSWVEVHGLELYYSSTVRTSADTGSFPTDMPRSHSIGTNQVTGDGCANCKFIGLITHDDWGAAAWPDATNIEVAENIAFYTGWEAPDRGHGHGWYMQSPALSSASSPKFIRNISFKSHSHGFHNYGSDDFMHNFTVSENILFDNGALSNLNPRETNLRSGNGGDPVHDQTITNNYTYMSPSVAGGNNVIGSTLTGGCGTGITVSGNYFAAANGTALLLGDASCATGLTMTGNTFVGGLTNFTSSNYASNTYLTSGTATGTAIKVVPRSYAPGVLHVAAYNWGQAASVNADLSAYYSAGETIDVIDVQNWPVVATTITITDASAVPLPMNLTTVRATVGTTARAPVHTDSRFAAFVIRRALNSPSYNGTTISYKADASTTAHQWVFSNSSRTTLVGSKTTNSQASTTRTWTPSGLTGGQTYYYSIAVGDTSYSGSFVAGAASPAPSANSVAGAARIAGTASIK
jgi:hypothetical protein